MSIVLHIERLVLDEAVLDGARPAMVRKAIEHELAQRLAQPGALDALPGIGTAASLPSHGLPEANAARGSLGGRIAAAVAQGLGIGPAAGAVGMDGMNGGGHG